MYTQLITRSRRKSVAETETPHKSAAEQR